MKKNKKKTPGAARCWSCTRCRLLGRLKSRTGMSPGLSWKLLELELHLADLPQVTSKLFLPEMQNSENISRRINLADKIVIANKDGSIGAGGDRDNV